MDLHFLVVDVTYALSMNPNAIHLLENINTSWIHIESLLMNTNGWKLLEKTDFKFMFESYDRRELNDLFSQRSTVFCCWRDPHQRQSPMPSGQINPVFMLKMNLTQSACFWIHLRILHTIFCNFNNKNINIIL